MTNAGKKVIDISDFSSKLVYTTRKHTTGLTLIEAIRRAKQYNPY